MKISGLDLAAQDRNCSGYAVIDLSSMSLAKVVCLYSDEQIVSSILSDSVELVSMDSPIVEEPRFRSVDREAIRRGFRIMSPSFKSMKKLTQRGWKLYSVLSSEGIKVIETHPSSALKSSGAGDCFKLAELLGLNLGNYKQKIFNKDLRDALVSALVALCYVRGDCLLTISAEDGEIYLIRSVNRTR